MLNMTSLSRNLNCEPPLAVYLALELHSQTRSKKLVKLLHKYSLSVSYNKVLSIETSFAQAIADRTKINADIVCPTHLRKQILTVAALDNLDHKRLEQHGIHKTVNRTRLKETVLKHFPDMTEEKGHRERVFIVCSKAARKIISDAIQTPDEEEHTLLMAASILRKAVMDHNTPFSFDGSFPSGCEESSVPHSVLSISSVISLQDRNHHQ